MLPRSLLALVLVLLACPAWAQSYIRIATCGDATPPAGASQGYMDSTGKICTSASSSGGTVVTQATAGAAPPSYSAGANNLSQNLSGGLRMQPSLGGTDMTLGQKTMAASLPVVIASDQSAISITPTSATPAAGTASAIVTGGSATTLITGPVKGCYITNPMTATGQNIATAEVAYVNAVTTATAVGNGTNVRLDPGQTFYCVPGQTTNVSAIAATTGHAFSVTKW